MLFYMPRDYLTDEKVLRKCMETYPLPFGTASQLLDSGVNVKTKEGFAPYPIMRRLPQPPNRQIFLSNALVSARRQKGAKAYLEESEKVRDKVLLNRPEYPEYVREPKSNINKDVADDDDIVELDDRQRKRLNELLNRDDDMVEEETISVQVLPSGELAPSQ